MKGFSALLGLCCVAIALAVDVSVPPNGEIKLLPEQKGDRLEGHWKVSTLDDCYIIISCGLWSNAGRTCKDKILITLGSKESEVCSEGSNTFHVQQDKNFNTAEIMILTNTPGARAMCTVYSVNKPKEENPK